MGRVQGKLNDNLTIYESASSDEEQITVQRQTDKHFTSFNTTKKQFQLHTLYIQVLDDLCSKGIRSEMTYTQFLEFLGWNGRV